MERFTLNNYEDGVLDPVLKAQEIADRKISHLADSSFIHTVAETDGLTPLLQVIIGHALPLI